MAELMPITMSALDIDLNAQFESAGTIRDQSQARSTRKRYRAARDAYLAWCDKHNADRTCPAVVGTYLNSLAQSGAKLASVEVTCAAILDGIRSAGIQFDVNDDDFRRILSGIRRTARKVQKTVAPIETDDVKAILALPGESKQLVRDKALVALGFGHALRGPSELLQLDYGQLGSGNGFIVLTAFGIEIYLESSKASQESAEVLVCNVQEVRKRVADWIEAGSIVEGSPLFRGLRKGGAVMQGRMSGQGMQNAIQRLMKQVLSQRLGFEEAAAASKRYGTHSLRKGLATSMARLGRSPFEIQRITRHRSLASVERYVVLGGQATKPVSQMLDD